jgi:hypothetical protein
MTHLVVQYSGYPTTRSGFKQLTRNHYTMIADIARCQHPFLGATAPRYGVFIDMGVLWEELCSQRAPNGVQELITGTPSGSPWPWASGSLLNREKELYLTKNRKHGLEIVPFEIYQEYSPNKVCKLV